MAPWFDLVIPSAAEMYFSEHPASACGRKVKDRSRMDIVEHNDSYVVTIDAPGLAQDDIKVELKEGTLRITGEKSKEDKENAHGNVIYSEKRKQSFFRFSATIRCGRCQYYRNTYEWSSERNHQKEGT